ncbi:hypothetical protein CFAM422_012100 [Trichoderma lentiforme]|uniref:Uncharacterized protein n=1 Tax=Trichoderma lentiforme TaxID=1567552 RepID=A0A9P4X507_9HYPO|nr:hypothetical protein CFAM422_012100 [Trichoderma lentiforme]
MNASKRGGKALAAESQNMRNTFVANVATISEDLLRRAASDGGQAEDRNAAVWPRSGAPPNAVPS